MIKIKIFKKYINKTFEDEKALVEITNNNQIVLIGDCYHDKIYEQIEGFLKALQYLNIEFKVEDTELISPNNDLFYQIGFSNENYDD